MKKAILIFVFLHSLIVFSQGKISINVYECNFFTSFQSYAELNLHNEDSLIKQFWINSPDYYSNIDSSVYLIDSLKQGTYYLKYKTEIGKEFSIPVSVYDNSTTKINVCVDSINYRAETYNPIINRLKNGEFFEINIESLGCFHSSKKHVKFFKKNDSYFCSYLNETKQLNEQKIGLIKVFEWQLNYQRENGCTSEDKYIVTYKNESFSIIDGSCSWYGINNLLINLKFIKE